MDRRYVVTAIGAALASLTLGVRRPRMAAQTGATPAATPVGIVTAVLIDRQQRRTGIATLTEGADGQVTLGLRIDPGALAPGEYDVSLHETGICDPSGDVPFSAAGGAEPNTPSEALITLTIDGDAATTFEASTSGFSLDALSDRDGSALVIARAGDGDAGDLIHAGDRVACGVVYPPAEIATAEATPGATPAAATPTAAATPEAAAATEVTVEMVDIDFNPNELTIPANTDVTVHLPNHGVTTHNFHIDPLDVHSEDVPPGEETTVTINAAPGDYEYYCSIPGHRQAGMVGTMHVE